MTQKVHPALAGLFNEDHPRVCAQIQCYGLTIVQGEQGITSLDQPNQEWTHRLELEIGTSATDITLEVELIVGEHAMFDELASQQTWLPSAVKPNSSNNGVLWFDSPDKALAVIATTPEMIQSIVLALDTNAQSWMEITVSGPFVQGQRCEMRAIFAFAIINALSRTANRGVELQP
jgi:hypothetical protein